MVRTPRILRVVFSIRGCGSVLGVGPAAVSQSCSTYVAVLQYVCQLYVNLACVLLYSMALFTKLTKIVMGIVVDPSMKIVVLELLLNFALKFGSTFWLISNGSSELIKWVKYF